MTHRALQSADIIICTPEKWDGISRSWQNRGYVQRVGLLIIDEIHLLGADRCVSRPPAQPLCMPLNPAQSVVRSPEHLPSLHDSFPMVLSSA